MKFTCTARLKTTLKHYVAFTMLNGWYCVFLNHMQCLSVSKHALSCFHQRAPVLSRQTAISYPRSELVPRDVHGQILDEQLSAWFSGEGSSTENENIFLLDEVPDQLYLG